MEKTVEKEGRDKIYGWMTVTIIHHEMLFFEALVGSIVVTGTGFVLQK
jgi:hypothetical protein